MGVIIRHHHGLFRKRVYANPQEISDLLTYHGGLMIFTWLYLYVIMPAFIGGPGALSDTLPEVIYSAVMPFLVPIETLAAHIALGVFILAADAAVYERIRFHGGPWAARYWQDQVDSLFALLSFTALAFGIIAFCWATALSG